MVMAIVAGRRPTRFAIAVLPTRLKTSKGGAAS
jgi:hypothetical protein